MRCSIGMSEAPLLGRGLTKAYGGVTVVDGVNIAVHANQIHAVIGENGAGKSTLMNMLTGAVRPDAGEIRLNGTLIQLRSPRNAAEAGIAIVHQELQLVPRQSVADNLMLVRPPQARAIRRRTRAERRFVHSMLERVGLEVALGTRVSDLPMAQCQLLEIAKALALDARVIIFDEPTAALLPAEVERLLTLIEALREEGKAILYISHALDEVLRLADRISVLRDGRLVREFDRGQTNREELIQTMVDRPVGLYAHEPLAAREELVFTAKQVATDWVRDLTFELHASEILGFAGLLGCGMREAALALCGEETITSGTLTLDGEARRFRSPHEAALAGVVMVPEERKAEGIIPNLSVCDNFHIGRYRCHARGGFVSPNRLRMVATDLVHRFKIRLNSIDQQIETLSGGNQQKVLIARCVQSEPRVLIIASPTRGVDIAAKETIHKIILDLAAHGTTIIVMSSELEELLSLAHRVAVFRQGRMVAILPREQATPTRIMRIAIGGADRSEAVRAA
jgi:ABC-type sugar transport system ATPase subunit